MTQTQKRVKNFLSSSCPKIAHPMKVEVTITSKGNSVYRVIFAIKIGIVYSLTKTVYSLHPIRATRWGISKELVNFWLLC